MTVPVKTNLDLEGNQILNQVGHKLAQAPLNPQEALVYYSTTDHCFYYYNGTNWVTEPDVSKFITAVSADILSNKTINATTNTIQNLSTNNFAANIIVKEIGAVGLDTTIPTEKAVRTAINSALIGGLIYKGEWSATSQTDFSSIELPVKKGYMYLVTGTATTIGNVTYTAGDYIVVNTDTSSTETLTQARINKIDNTESSDLVKLAVAQTLTNKTINAANNTISNITLDMLKSGEVINTITNGSTKAITSGAVYTGLAAKAPLASPALTGTPTAPTAAKGTNTTQIATTAFVATAIASKGTVNKITATNPALTPSNGVATWTVTHNLNTQDVIVQVRAVADNKEVITDVALTSATTVTISFNSAENIAASTYKAVVLG